MRIAMDGGTKSLLDLARKTEHYSVEISDLGSRRIDGSRLPPVEGSIVATISSPGKNGWCLAE